MYEPAFSSCKECLWTPKHPPCAHFPNPLLYGYAISISISVMEVVKKGMQHNLLLENGNQFVPCSPFIALECILSTNGECGIDFHAALLRNCLYSLIQHSPTEEHRFSLSYSSLQSECWFDIWKCLPCLWSVILEATAFSPIPISESWCCCESTPFPMRWWLMRSRPVQCIPVSFLLSPQS